MPPIETMSAGPTIGLLGDVMLGRMVAESLATTEPERLWSEELRALCRRCDAVICNLECCISDRGRPTTLIADKPFFFRAPPRAVDALEAIGVSAVGLANNHALDFGRVALADTLEHLDRAGIAHSGAGAEPEDARREALVAVGGRTLGLLAVSTHPEEYAVAPGRIGIARDGLRGAVPDWLGAQSEQLAREADFVLFFPHWGPNMATEPPSARRRFARSLLDAGVDLIAGHSAHVFHGAELHRGRPILYDLGGALDDYAVDPVLRNDLGLMALWRPGSEPEIELVGLRLDYCSTALAAGRDADWIANRLRCACADLGTEIERTAEQRFALRGGAQTSQQSSEGP